MVKKLKYIFIIRQLCSGGAESSTIILGKQLAIMGHEIEVWNTGVYSQDDIKKWDGWSTVKQISKFQLLFYKKISTEQMILVNNVGHKYAPNTAISILHGDCLEKFFNARSYSKKIRELVKVKFKFSKRQNINISKLLTEKLQPFTSKTVEYIPNPFDSKNVLDKANDKITYDLPSKFIVHVGRMSPEKNQELLLCDYLSNNKLNSSADLVFIGGDVSKKINVLKKLISIANGHPLRKKVHFLGDITNPFPIMKCAKCLVLCSKTESMGYVLLEAISLNLPIISTCTNGAREVLGEDFIGLVKTGESISEKVLMALRNPEKFKLELSDEYEAKPVAIKFENFVASLSKNLH